MANLRNFKKDVTYLVEEVISDCWAFMYFNPEKNAGDCNDIINDAIDFRDEMFTKINHPEKDNVKGYYKGLNRELLEKIDALFERISQLNK